MFGDVLSTEECGKLITDLALCDLPFQCAHGRPTCAPLFELTRFAEVKCKQLLFYYFFILFFVAG